MQPIHWAAEAGTLKAVKWLIASGAKIDSADNDGAQSLHYAAENDHLEVVEWLSEHGADIHATDNGDVQPLHYAAENGSFTVVEWLVINGVDINTEDSNGHNALYYARATSNSKLILWLIKHGATLTMPMAFRMDGLRNERLVRDVLAGSVEYIEKQFDEGADAKTINTCLPLLIALHYQDLVAFVIENKVDLINEWHEALEVAAATGDAEAFAWLYAAITQRIGTIIEPEEFLRMLENALHWALIADSRVIIEDMLELMRTYGAALSGAIVKLVSRRHGITQADKEALISIQHSLVDEVRMTPSIPEYLTHGLILRLSPDSISTILRSLIYPVFFLPTRDWLVEK